MSFVPNLQRAASQLPGAINQLSVVFHYRSCRPFVRRKAGCRISVVSAYLPNAPSMDNLQAARYSFGIRGTRPLAGVCRADGHPAQPCADSCDVVDGAVAL